MAKYIMLLLTILMLSFALTSGELSVKFAAVIYSNGEKTPIELYPTDICHNESVFPAKFEQLTNEGIRQQFALGKWLKNRYANLISEKFDPSETYIRSIDDDCALTSALANLAGMYPAAGDSIWNQNLTWQPIPIHTVPVENDEVLAMAKKCMRYDAEKESYIQSKSYHERLMKYRELMKFLTICTGKKIKNFSDMTEIYNILHFENLYNLTLPNWTSAVFPKRLQEAACHSFGIATATPVMARLKVGPLLKEIVSKMNTVISEEEANPLKLTIYSGYGYQIGNVLTAMGVFDGNCPVSTATVFLEVLQDNATMEYYVRMLYRNSTEIVEPYVLRIAHCGRLCPFERFINLYHHLIAVDYELDCTILISLKPMLYYILFIVNIFIAFIRCVKALLFGHYRH